MSSPLCEFLSVEFPGSVAKYILVDKTPKRCDDIDLWGAWYEQTENRRVAHDTIGSVRISTMFLGIDMALKGFNEKPELFETRIFGGELDQYVTRCATWEDALDAHAGAIKLVQSEGVSDANVAP